MYCKNSRTNVNRKWDEELNRRLILLWYCCSSSYFMPQRSLPFINVLFLFSMERKNRKIKNGVNYVRCCWEEGVVGSLSYMIAI
uniref:Uncharacterized protein n=1 Tax=Lepeophtheirus salmonis TaxID=72036 RepID=A0A0K2UJH6_LEPSM